MDVVYSVGSKYWDTELGEWVTNPDPAKEIVVLTNDGEPADEEFLIRTLQLYKFPLGELAPAETQQSLEERIASLEKELAEMKELLASFQTSSGSNGGISLGYDIENVGRAVEHLTHKVADLTEATTENVKEEKENAMGDIAGLLALMQGNKGMDLPGLLALCKEKGYDRGWGGEGMFLFVFLILFLFAGGGWSNLGRNNQEAFAAMAGNNCQDIIGLHDRIADARSVSQLGFQSLQTWLCESIANVTNSVRNQGDRAVDTTRNVGDTVRDCCCKLEAALATLNCKVDGVSRDIRE